MMVLGQHDEIPMALDKAMIWQSLHLWDSWLSNNTFLTALLLNFTPSPKV